MTAARICSEGQAYGDILLEATDRSYADMGECNLHVDRHTYVMGMSHCHLGENYVAFVFQRGYVPCHNKTFSNHLVRTGILQGGQARLRDVLQELGD